MNMQLSLFDPQAQIELARTQHGGEVRRCKRKLERPVSTRRPMHVVLTSHRARGPWSLRKHDRAGRDIWRSMARRFDIRIYDCANVGSHLHIVLRARRRDAFQGFCDRLRASSLGGSRGQEGPTQAGASSPAWLGRVSLTGVATSWACGTMSFATKSKGPRAREFAKPSRMARLERSTHRSEWRRDHRLRDVALGLAFIDRGRPNCIGDLGAGPVSLKGSPMI